MFMGAPLSRLAAGMQKVAGRETQQLQQAYACGRARGREHPLATAARF
jgi:hypothetical protein